MRGDDLVLAGLLLLASSSQHVSSFVLPLHSRSIRLRKQQSLPLAARPNSARKRTGGDDGGGEVTLKELIKQYTDNPNEFLDGQTKTNRRKAKRTRKRVENPKQHYIYASQKRKLQAAGKLKPKPKKESEDEENTSVKNKAPQVDEFSPLVQARKLGLVNPSSQHCDAKIEAVEPEIMATIRVGEGNSSSSFAYIIEKPAGWAILGGDGAKKAASEEEQAPMERAEEQRMETGKRTYIDHDDDNLHDFDETDILAAMTPEEQQEYLKEVSGDTRPNQSSSSTMGPVRQIRVKDKDGQEDVIDFSEADMMAAMTPKEIAEFEAEGGFDETDSPVVRKTAAKAPVSQSSTSEAASLGAYSRPSVVSWLKGLKAEDGTPIRGGKFWTAVAGATNVDDSGLVVLCPKEQGKNIFIDFCKYVAVVGNGKFLAPKPKTLEDIAKDLVEMEILAKVRKGRFGDNVVTVGVAIVDMASTCSHVVQVCQAQLQDGIRGDPTANPFDRRAPRRLVHCDAISVSSLAFDDAAEAESENLPDDIAVVADRRNHHEYNMGTFLGRAELGDNPYTNIYREINGAADGFIGWTVDRYDRWLLVQHDDRYPKGPLPSIHDGMTVGVYYLPANPNRGAMGRDEVRPVLLEGQPAPAMVPVQENGVTYLVNLDQDLSTGIFLDQRPQRAWLTRNCNDKTRVLNCFAHCGGFSVAAASTGAATVSLDLNKKWLDRIEPQMELNGVDFNKHDCIYGDCFDWLARLGKRGETFDIVILDPPSSSVGKKKKRWSVRNDMGELVALAAPLVKRGGLLWTTTNNAGLHPIKFATMCKKGLDGVGLEGAKLERVVPMPVDFPSIGPNQVKNLVWRIPT